VYGKPKDILDVNQGPVSVQIIHRLRGAPDDSGKK
jgi:hypothetical protein